MIDHSRMLTTSENTSITFLPQNPSPSIEMVSDNCPIDGGRSSITTEIILMKTNLFVIFYFINKVLKKYARTYAPT